MSLSPNLETKELRKKKKNHWKWFVPVILLIVVIFLMTGCGLASNNDSDSGATQKSLQVNSNDQITFPSSQDVFNQQYDVTGPNNPISVESNTISGITTTEFSLSDIGLTANRTVRIVVE